MQNGATIASKNEARGFYGTIEQHAEPNQAWALAVAGITKSTGRCDHAVREHRPYRLLDPPKSTPLSKVSSPMSRGRPRMTSFRPCRVGDLWQLGPHRLICGNALDRTTVATLMSGERANGLHRPALQRADRWSGRR